MLPSYMIRYQFDTSAGDISTDEENILIGFSTQEKKGTLMFVRNDADPFEYISIEINNNGRFLSCFFDICTCRIKFYAHCCHNAGLFLFFCHFFVNSLKRLLCFTSCKLTCQWDEFCVFLSCIWLTVSVCITLSRSC